MTAGSSSSCIAGFHQSYRFSRSSAPRRWCVGIEPAFARIGVGSRAHGANPKLGKCILKKTSENAAKLRLQAAINRRVKIAAPALAHKLGVLDVIEASLPGYLSENDRKDIIADMWTSVAEGRLLPTEVCTRARQFVSAHLKMYPTTDRWAPASLDAPIRDDNPLPRLERIAEGEGLWS